MNKKQIISALLLYLISAGSSFAAFSYLPNPLTNPTGTTSDDTPIVESTLLDIKPEDPKTEVCPLNGQKYTVKEREAWEKRRPLAIMVENSVDARPHSGLNKSDIVYEALAEGGVTRFMPIYYCDAQANSVAVAPVRSVRVPFIEWVSEYGEYPLIAHVGGANCSADPGGPCKTAKSAQAIELLGSLGWRYQKGNDLDQFAIGAPTFQRKENRLFDIIGKNVATEHSVVTQTERLWNIAKERGWTNISPEGEDWTDAFTPWKFQTEEVSQKGDVSTIAFDFWEGYKQYDAKWDYDKTANVYKRSTGGEVHKDLETGEQLVAKNVVVLLTKEIGPVDELKHMLYETTGKGVAYIFQDGKAIKGSWSKSKRTTRLIFSDEKGKEIQFVPGRIWISVVATDTKVSY